MAIRYSLDTDTALIDLDAAGNLVSITIEHAKEYGTPSELVYRVLPEPIFTHRLQDQSGRRAAIVIG